MIISVINGGLGNQMLQYAAGRTLADELKTDLYLDLNWYNNIGNNTKRKFLLNELQTRYKTDIDFSYGNYYESSPYYKKIEVSGNARLHGYFFSYKYHNEKVYQDFISKDIDIYHKLDYKNTVAIHFRRTDKINSIKHYALDIEYYHKAMELVESKIKNPVYLVFGDDLDLVSKSLKSKHKMSFINHNEIIDLTLQSKCEHNIIANSSFSWWAALLNKNKDKIVIAPEIFYRNEKNNYDIYPKEWSLI